MMEIIMNMKAELYFICLFAGVMSFTACNYEPEWASTSGTNSNTVSKYTPSPPKAGFTCKVVQPLSVVLTNTSTNAVVCAWDFGDGSEQSMEKSPTHRYAKAGTYTITLLVFNTTNESDMLKENNFDACQMNVTIKNPTTCYLTGFSITKIPNNNYYYQVQITDDYAIFKTLYTYTNWYQIASSKLPFNITYTNAFKLDISKKYMVRLYKNSSKQTDTGSGKGFWSAAMTAAALQAYPATLTYYDSNTAIQLLFKWE